MADDFERYYITARPTLNTRRAGQSARDKAEELRRQAPVKSFLSRLLDVRTNERAWRKGAAGERRVGEALRKLPIDWHVFNDVPIGTKGANVDHLVVGPGGVFTINTKNLSGNVWVAERVLMHNGRKTSYLPKASREAARAADYLSAALARPVSVYPVLAIICDSLKVKVEPPDVAIVRANQLTSRLVRRLIVLTAPEALAIARAADDPSTWR